MYVYSGMRGYLGLCVGIWQYVYLYSSTHGHIAVCVVYSGVRGYIQVYSGMHMSVPVSQFIPPSPFPMLDFVFPACWLEGLEDSQGISYTLFHILFLLVGTMWERIN